MSASGSRPGVKASGVVEAAGGPIEYTWIDGRAAGAPIVLLHEGLGCVALWRDFPLTLAEATGRSVLVYSRYGYGQSGRAHLPRPVGYMHTEALEVLPELAQRLELPPAVLVGHSDGASIALIAAGAGALPVVGIGLLAPHVFVEDVSVVGIAAARQRYLTDGRFRAGLARYHRDPDATFWGWNDVWLSDAFRSWDITDGLAGIEVPVLVVQGTADDYGTPAQIGAIGTAVAGPCTSVLFDDVGHAPHVERPAETTAALVELASTLP